LAWNLYKLSSMKSAYLFLLLFSNLAFSSEQISGAYKYKSPHAFDFITTAPKNYGDFVENSFEKNSLKGLAVIAGATGALYIFDQQILEETQRFGRKIGLDNKDHSKPTFTIGDDHFMYAPTDVGSSILFLGDGWTTIGLSAGFLTSGLLNHNAKSKLVASELMQGLLFSGFSSQVLKRISGREIPNARTKDRGRFSPFASPKEFNDNKARYDSFPSAHLMTAMTSLTILAENYEEMSWIRPVGYSLVALLSFQLMNTGAHWASDLPLAIGIGHMAGKTIAQNGRTPAPTTDASQVTFAPLFSPYGSLNGAQFVMTF